MGPVLRGLLFSTLVGGIAGLLHTFPDLINAWWSETFSPTAGLALYHLPLLFWGLAALWGIHLGQVRFLFLCIALWGIHFIRDISWGMQAGLPATGEAVALVAPWAFPLLLALPERGWRHLWGWGRWVAVALLWGGVLFLAISEPHLFRGSGDDGRILMGVSVLMALLTLRISPGEERRLLRGFWAWALVSLSLASSGWILPWPGAISKAVWPVFALISGIFLLSGLYSLTWRRAYLDELTDLPGRRALEERLRRLGGSYTIAMVDVDRFKQFNDRYGHSMGDHVLRFVASRLKRITGGRAFRYGGEEFTVVWPGRSAEEVLPLLDSFRLQVEKSRLIVRGKDRPKRRPRGGKRPRGGTKKVGVTVSIGVAQRSRLHSTPWGVLQAADAALYRAKRKGRNRIEVERRHQPRS